MNFAPLRDLAVKADPPMSISEKDESERDVGITGFDFEHRVFKTPGARFLLKGHDKIPTFRVDMGDLDGLIEIQVLRKEFGIGPDSHDGKLIDLAVQGLRYVPDIRPGDTVPSELLDGKASWTVSPKHKKLAEQRLQVQLLSWVSGKEVLLTDSQEIELFLGQIENKEKLRTAFRNAAEALGHGPENVEPVIKQIELLAREVCYIEALRDRYALIPKIELKMNELARSFGNDRNAKLELNRVRSLLQVGIKEYGSRFSEADAQTGEIISALKSIDRQVKFIRDIRDDLHFLLMQWNPHIVSLDQWQTRRTPQTDRVMSSLYRFLAPRFSSGRSILKRNVKRAGGETEKDSPAATDPAEKKSKASAS